MLFHKTFLNYVMVKRLLLNGKLIEDANKEIGKYFSLKEWRFQEDLRLYGELIVCDPLIKVLDAFRERIKEPINITSFNRNDKRQKELQRDTRFKAAAFSPHVVYLAADIVPESISTLHNIWLTNKSQETRNQIIKKLREYKSVLENVSKELGIKIRIGIDDYIRNNQSFIHIDVCPEYYGPGKVWFDHKVPEPWRREARW